MLGKVTVYMFDNETVHIWGTNLMLGNVTIYMLDNETVYTLPT